MSSDPYDFGAAPSFNPLSNEQPDNGALYDQWKKQCRDQRARARFLDQEPDSQWDSPVTESDLDLIRDGIEHDDFPTLPVIVGKSCIKPRWESFCRLYAYGHSAASAARHAGYAQRRARHAGWRLLQDERILDRIRTLQEHARQNCPQNRGDLMARLETVYREAMNRGQYSACIRALECIDRLEGQKPGTAPGSASDSLSGTDETEM